MNKLKSFNEWMNENVKNEVDTQRRFVAFNPKSVPHPIILADHVWNQCAVNYTLRLDSFLTQMRLLMKDDPRATALINSFKEEMVKTMVANAVGFVEDKDAPNDEQPVKRGIHINSVGHEFKLV